MKIKESLLTRLEKVSPKWTSALRQYNMGLPIEYIILPEDGVKKGFNLHETCCCIVGEAYQFKDTYSHMNAPRYCVKCKLMSIDLFEVYESADVTAFEIYLGLFLDHFEEMHGKK